MRNLLTEVVYADTLSEQLSTKINSDGGIFANWRQGDGLGTFVSDIVGIALPLAGTAALVLLIISGYKMISSQGNPDKLKDAKEMATNAIIGLVFILLSVAILALVSNVFNLGVTS
jgi:hypothetical protein